MNMKVFLLLRAIAQMRRQEILTFLLGLAELKLALVL